MYTIFVVILLLAVATQAVPIVESDAKVPQKGWIVVFKAGVSDDEIENHYMWLESGKFARIFNKYSVLGKTKSFKGYAAEFSSAAILSAVKEMNFVDFIEANTRVEIQAVQANPISWGLDRMSQRSLPLDNLFHYPDNAGEGIELYVMDTGINIDNVDFGGRAFFASDHQTEDPDEYDHCDHGTSVASVAAGTQFGVAKNATILSVKVMDGSCGGWMSDVESGINWINRNATPKKSVVNLSFVSRQNTASMERAIEASVDNDIVYAAAAGNGGADACTYGPARLGGDGIIFSIGGTANNDTLASWSNWGRCVNAYGPALLVAAADAPAPNAFPNSYRERSGTSFSSPYVAGITACYLSAYDLDPYQVMSRVLAAGTQGEINPPPTSTPSSPSTNLLIYINESI